MAGITNDEGLRRMTRLRQIPMGRMFLDFARLHANACMMGENVNVSFRRYRAADEVANRAHDRICRAIESSPEDVIAFLPDFPSMTR
jgi:DNA-binding Xre family transcriptional regulator